MKNTKLLAIAAGVVVLVSLIFTFSNTTEEIPYPEFVEKERNNKDQYFINGEESPLPEEDKRSFKGLNYFPVSENFRVIASLERFTEMIKITMATSDGKKKEYFKYARAHFTVLGEELSLTLFRAAEATDDYLFVPFADETSAESTYGAGRYLDLEITDEDQLVIDFNLSYNPYCAYNTNYSCPLPPRENYLAIAVEAGEKNYMKTETD